MERKSEKKCNTDKNEDRVKNIEAAYNKFIKENVTARLADYGEGSTTNQKYLEQIKMTGTLLSVTHSLMTAKKEEQKKRAEAEEKNRQLEARTKEFLKQEMMRNKKIADFHAHNTREIRNAITNANHHLKTSLQEVALMAKKGDIVTCKDSGRDCKWQSWLESHASLLGMQYESRHQEDQQRLWYMSKRMEELEKEVEMIRSIQVDKDLFGLEDAKADLSTSVAEAAKDQESQFQDAEDGEIQDAEDGEILDPLNTSTEYTPSDYQGGTQQKSIPARIVEDLSIPASTIEVEDGPRQGSSADQDEGPILYIRDAKGVPIPIRPSRAKSSATNKRPTPHFRPREEPKGPTSKRIKKEPKDH